MNVIVKETAKDGTVMRREKGEILTSREKEGAVLNQKILGVIEADHPDLAAIKRKNKVAVAWCVCVSVFKNVA